MIQFLKIDEDFPHRVLNTSLLVAGLLVLVSHSLWSFEVTTGLTIGMGISVLLFWILCSSASRLLEPNMKRGSLFLFATLSKYFIVTAFLIFVFPYMSINLMALLIGISLVYLVIIFKLAGIGLVNFINNTVR